MTSDFQKLFDVGKKYLETRLELFKLDTKDQLDQYLVKLGILIGSTLLIISVIFFLSMGFAYLLNSKLESEYLGFFIIAGIIFFLMVLLILTRNSKTIQSALKRIVDYFIFD